MDLIDQEASAGAPSAREHPRRRIDSADEAAGYDSLGSAQPADNETKLSEEVAGASSYVDDIADTDCKVAESREQQVGLLLSDVYRPLATPDTPPELEGRFSFPQRCTDSSLVQASGVDNTLRCNYLPPPFGGPIDDDQTEPDIEEDVITHCSPRSRLNVQFSPVSSECSDMTSSMAMSDCSMALGATGYSPSPVSRAAMSPVHSPSNILRGSPDAFGTAEAYPVQRAGPASEHRRRRTVQIADPGTYESFPANIDNAEFGPFGDYGSLADVDFVDVNSNELNNNTIQMDNANPRDAQSGQEEVLSSPPPRQRALSPPDDAYYDTISSTSSTSNLLKRVGREGGSSAGKRDIGDFFNGHLGPDVDLKLGQVLLNKTLEQVKRSLEEISPTLDTVIAPIGSSAKLMHTYLKNLVVLSIGFMFSFIAFFSLRNLQSSINHAAGLGLASLSCMYATFVVGCLTATAVIQKIRPKHSIILFLFGNLVFIAANFYPNFYTMLPATGFLGLCQAYLWVAQGTYLTSIAVSYAVAARKRPEHILGLFNGFFLFLLQIAQIFGNLISSSVFSFAIQKTNNVGDAFPPFVYLNKSASSNVRILKSNQSVRDGSSDVDMYQFYLSSMYPRKGHRFDTAICGAAYCHVYPIHNQSADIDYQTIAMLLTIFAVFTSIGILILGLGLDKLDVIFHKSKQCLAQQLCSIGKLHGNPKLLLSMTLMVFLGMEEAFMYGEVTKAFVTCPLGVHMVGYVMMCFGGCNAIGSFFIGQLQRCVHRIVIFSLGAILYASLLGVMLIWIPSNDDFGYVFALAGALGFSDALWQTQICSLVGLLFPSADREAAFASLRMYESVGFCIAFGYAQFLCMDIKMFLLGGVLLFGMINYLLMEFFIDKPIESKPGVPSIEV